MLHDDVDYQDLGPDHFLNRNPDRARNRAFTNSTNSATASPSTPSRQPPEPVASYHAQAHVFFESVPISLAGRRCRSENGGRLPATPMPPWFMSPCFSLTLGSISWVAHCSAAELSGGRRPRPRRRGPPVQRCDDRAVRPRRVVSTGSARRLRREDAGRSTAATCDAHPTPGGHRRPCSPTPSRPSTCTTASNVAGTWRRALRASLTPRRSRRECWPTSTRPGRRPKPWPPPRVRRRRPALQHGTAGRSREAEKSRGR